ncbi:MAG: phosphate butyryltransferase [Candidatus Zixiibacteriota bacterium]|nr:MAG: phosphate butyryltransferase [candidate division Zixibacteria bacterium]
MAIHSADELIAQAVATAQQGKRPVVAVAAAQDGDVIEAVVEAHAEGFLDGILVGDADRIKALADEKQAAIDTLEVINVPDVSEAAHYAVKLASEKKADAVMKGFLPTSALLKTVLDKRYNLRGKNTLSHCAVLDIPGYRKLLNVTDGGMVVKPDEEQKVQVLDNAVMVARALGLSPMKVAVSGLVAATEQYQSGKGKQVKEFVAKVRRLHDDCVIEGPMSLDAATSAEAAEKYGLTGEVPGDADIYLVDSIEEGNLVSKTLIQLAQAVFCGVIVGAKVPVSLVSRTDTARNKKASLAIACVIADYYRRHSLTEGE